MRLRFTIRDLLWLTVVVALVVGWWVDRRHFVEFRHEQAVNALLAHDEVMIDLKKQLRNCEDANAQALIPRIKQAMAKREAAIRPQIVAYLDSSP